MGLFGGKKPDRDQIIAEGLAQAEADAAAAGQEKKDETFNSGNPKMDLEITKIQAQIESFNELRKANSERFTRISEQMGELRGMIMDTNKTISKIEVSATKAIDLVESVQPEKLMIEIRKQEGKGEALKANIESNEALMKDLMEELKKMRQQMNFYKGIEQVAKLNEEVKGEILEIKKVEATIERHADKAESIFLDLEKKFAEFDKFLRTVDEIDKNFHAIQNDFDNMKVQLSSKADKKEFLNLMDKFTEFEKHTGNIMKLLDERSKHMKIELKDTVQKVKEQLKRRQGITIDTSSIQDEKLPAEESQYLNKVESAPAKPQAKENESPEAAAEGPAETTPETKAEDSGNKKKNEDKGIKAKLMDVFNSRKIITKGLSDEGESNQAGSIPPESAENPPPEKS
ncbi:hypothetical protein JW756_05895 [Candidatus Woesearchaeota archaeon]|nr:hypothetical protein [Candidatus Woesearchaeota archaeon]